jgi:hypothetical protein
MLDEGTVYTVMIIMFIISTLKKKYIPYNCHVNDCMCIYIYLEIWNQSVLN